MRSVKLSCNKSELVTIRLSSQLLNKIDKVASGYQCSRSEVIRMILEKSLCYVKE